MLFFLAFHFSLLEIKKNEMPRKMPIIVATGLQTIQFLFVV
jgi:hypothetical protein